MSKQGKILPSLIQYMLAIIRMTKDGGPPYIDEPHQKICSIKPLRHKYGVPSSLFSFYAMMFKPRKYENPN